MRCGEESRIIGYDGHQDTVTAQLIEHSVDELHKCVRIFFKSGVEGPVRVLWLWRRAADLLYGFSQFLPQSGKVNTYDKECGKNGSREI